MANLSDTAENQILEHVFRGQASTFNTNTYIALFTSAPVDADDSTTLTAKEVTSGNGYSRTQFNNKCSAASGGVLTTNQDIAWTASGGNFGTITHIGILDSDVVGAGTLLAYTQLNTSFVVNDGDTFTLGTGNVTITLD